MEDFFKQLNSLIDLHKIDNNIEPPILNTSL